MLFESWPRWMRDSHGEWAETDPRWVLNADGLYRLTGAPYGASYNPATGEVALEVGGKRRVLKLASVGARGADSALLASMPLAKDVRKVGTDALDLAAVSGIAPRIIAGPDQLRIVADVSDAGAFGRWRPGAASTLALRLDDSGDRIGRLVFDEDREVIEGAGTLEERVPLDAGPTPRALNLTLSIAGADANYASVCGAAWIQESNTDYHGGGAVYFQCGSSTVAPGAIYRSLLGFDASAAWPAGATIIAVTITLAFRNETASGIQTVGLHKCPNGPADIAHLDANALLDGAPGVNGYPTWSHRVFSTDAWTTAGGDFDAVALATQAINCTSPPAEGTPIAFTSAALAQYFQDKLDGGHGNWCLFVKNSAEVGAITLIRFQSDDHATTAYRPYMTIDYTLPGGGLFRPLFGPQVAGAF